MALSVCAGAAIAQPSRVLRQDEYADRLRAMWLAQCVANWTGLRTEGQRQNPPFYTDASWGTGSPQITFVFQDPFGADDDTDIEYVYLHLWNQHATNRLTSAQLASGWITHINRFIWVSNARARALMDRGVRPPSTGMLVANRDALRIDAQLTTELFGALAPGMPEVALDLADLAISTTATGYAAHAAEYFVVLYSLATQVPAGLSGRDRALWLVQRAREYLPNTSKSADVVDFVLADYLANPDANDWESTRDKVYQRYQLNAAANGFVYRDWYESTVNFAGGIAALLYGACDLKRTIQIGTLWGWDSDNATATLGGLLGLMHGTQWVRDAFPTQTLSDRFWVTRTRDNLPDYLPADAGAEDTFTLMAQRMLPRVEQTILEAGGRADADTRRWVLPRPAGGPAVLHNPTWQRNVRSANRRVRDEGGTVTASGAFGSPPPGDSGAGWPGYYANAVELDGRGREPSNADLTFYTSFGTGSTATLTVTYDRAVQASAVRFIEGDHYPSPTTPAPNGGWFTSVSVQLLIGGVWTPATGAWSEPLDAARPFQTMDFVLSAPATVTAVRLSGPAGGSNTFVTCAELDMLAPFAPPTRPSFDVNSDGRVDIEDLHAIHATPTDLDGSGAADEHDRAYLEALLRAGELADMRNGR
ncbi:MAG: ADP-ribosylglycohydrolase family protein [Planctomycetota bacterium]|nr:ADP-ribosylglycohydrolase family protein [Planctomycetota bacterium]